MGRAEGTIEIASWDEETLVEIDGGRKLTRATVEQRFHGDIEGEGSVTWLMAYRSDGTADVVGLQRIVGTIGDNEGSLVLRTEGDFDGTKADGSWTVVEGTATGALAGISGTGRSVAPVGGSPTYELDYEVN
ncbi:MAG: DUF3224 domain-containing protein [Mycobacteriales bacterium]